MIVLKQVENLQQCYETIRFLAVVGLKDLPMIGEGALDQLHNAFKGS